MVSTVKEILNPSVKTGMGAKGEWTQALVKLADGTETRMFQPIAIGAEVESYQNGDYTNWKVKVAPKTPTSESDGANMRYILRKLIAIDKKLDQLLTGEIADPSTDDEPMPEGFGLPDE